MTTTTPERKYALTKVATGDYLLPSNDGRKVWRIARYEDGPSHGLDDWTRDIMLWGVWEWTGKSSTYVDVGSWDRWEMWSSGHETRADAIATALGAQP
jgi:hypothetical protein